ncbi:MAG: ParB/RepB/Spo0J family partition protein [Pseudomonadota bacterium]|nr:ParB/RepB/Spo0J family partition protein [Pseudomonadota bacterium]
MSFDDDTPKRSSKGLGRGLSALLGEDPADDEVALARVRGIRNLPTADLRPGKYQPRRQFDEEEMRALVLSIRRQGVLQPILVRHHPAESGAYEIIAGERRWRAAQQAQLHEVPVLIRDFDDRETLEVALVENLQRQDLNPLEEAEAYRRLADEFGHAQAEIAEAVGKSRSHVANTVRLLALPDDVKDYVRSGRLSAGAARAILTADDPAALARQAVERGLNVRELEAIRRDVDQAASTPAGRKSRGSQQKDPDTQALERSMAEALGIEVDIRHKGQGGEVRLRYQTLEQLDLLCQRLTRFGR